MTNKAGANAPAFLSIKRFTDDAPGLLLEFLALVGITPTHPTAAWRSGSLVYLTPFLLRHLVPMKRSVYRSVLVAGSVVAIARCIILHSSLEDAPLLLSSPILVSSLFHRLFDLVRL